MADTEIWKQKMVQVLEELDEVICYAKNQNLGFAIPTPLTAKKKLLSRLAGVGGAKRRPLSLIIEVTGEKKKIS